MDEASGKNKSFVDDNSTCKIETGHTIRKYRLEDSEP
jgi:hypothetical protein